jgi:hypothetical protein
MFGEAPQAERSPRVYRGLDELAYPFHDATYT